MQNFFLCHFRHWAFRREYDCKEYYVKKSKTPTFQLELQLLVNPGQARILRAHFEAARVLYNALLGEALKRLHRLRTDPAWQAARSLPRAQKRERATAFSRLREHYSFSEYALHAFAKEANCTWIADHIDSTMAQTLATRAYQAVNRVCLGKAKKVRFRSKGRGLDSVRNKRNDTGLRFVLQPPEEGNQGWLICGKDIIPALIDWNDPVVKHGLGHRIKYAQLVRRKASSPKAKGADALGYRYCVQLVLEGIPFQKPKHRPGTDVIGLDLGPSTIAIVPHEGEARLVPLCEELAPDAREKRRLERKLAAHRKSLHGRLVHEIIRVGNDIHIEKIAYKGWQKRFGKSVGLRAPGMLIDHLKRTVASTGGTLTEFPTRPTKLSQYCHGCHRYAKKPLSERWHHCACGVGPVQRDLYSAFLAAYLNPSEIIPSSAQYMLYWESAELRLRAALEVLTQRAKEGQVLPRSVGISRAGARLPKNLANTQQELVYRRGRLEALQ
jgi:hypothetical protein